MKNLFDASAAGEIKNRVTRLTPESQRQWGTMTPAQAMAHCSASMEWAVGDRRPPRAGLGVRIMGRIVKPLALGSDAPLRRNSPTSEDLVVGDERDLAREQERLCRLIDRFVAGGSRGCTTAPHTFFGPLTPEEWATLTYKHLDHHLRQFGV
jgi:Protein of unknown function (DUF1569)